MAGEREREGGEGGRTKEGGREGGGEGQRSMVIFLSL